MDKNNQKIKRPKRQPKVEETWWDCSVCTYRNTASEAFKCLMCDVRKGLYNFSVEKLAIYPLKVYQISEECDEITKDINSVS